MTTNWIEEFEDKFIHTDWSGQKRLNMLYLTNHTKSDPIIPKEEQVLIELKSFITTLLEKQREEYVEMIRDYKFSDWSDEQAIYDQLEEIIIRIKSHDK